MPNVGNVFDVSPFRAVSALFTFSRDGVEHDFTIPTEKHARTATSRYKFPEETQRELSHFHGTGRCFKTALLGTLVTARDLEAIANHDFDVGCGIARTEYMEWGRIYWTKDISERTYVRHDCPGTTSASTNREDLALVSNTTYRSQRTNTGAVSCSYHFKLSNQTGVDDPGPGLLVGHELEPDSWLTACVNACCCCMCGEDSVPKLRKPPKMTVETEYIEGRGFTNPMMTDEPARVEIPNPSPDENTTDPFRINYRPPKTIRQSGGINSQLAQSESE